MEQTFAKCKAGGGGASGRPPPKTGITRRGLSTPSPSMGPLPGQGWSSEHQVASSTPPSPDLHLL